MAGEPTSPNAASPARRAAALGVDLLVLLAGLVGALTLGAAVSLELSVWFAGAWWIVVAPLYFALYHGRGTAQTPGEREVGVALRAAGTQRCVGIPRALLRSYVALLGTILVVPVVLDAAGLVAGGPRPSPRDRLFGTVVVPLSRSRRVPAPAPAEAFEFDRASRRTILRATLAAYVLLVLLIAVLAPLTIDDFGVNLDAAWIIGWYSTAIVVFVSGVYWTQAAIVLAVEATRAGGPPPSPLALVHRAADRVNALSIALVLLIAVAATSEYTVFLSLLLLARFALVVPVLELEGGSVLGAYRRSWSLTAGRTWRTLGLLLGSAALVFAALAIVLAVATGLVLLLAVNADAAVYIGAGAVALLVAAVPMSLLLARIGTRWSLLYYDRARAAAAGS